MIKDCFIFMTRRKLIEKILIPSPVMMNAAAVSFHNCNGSPKNIDVVNMPIIGTSNVNGAIVETGY